MAQSFLGGSKYDAKTSETNTLQQSVEIAPLSQGTYSRKERITRDLGQETTVYALCGNGGIQSGISDPNHGILRCECATAPVHALSTLRASRQHRFRRLVELVLAGQTCEKLGSL